MSKNMNQRIHFFAVHLNRFVLGGIISRTDDERYPFRAVNAFAFATTADLTELADYRPGART
jgi:hypothetical protein